MVSNNCSLSYKEQEFDPFIPFHCDNANSLHLTFLEHKGQGEIEIRLIAFLFLSTDGTINVRYGETAIVQFKASKRQGKMNSLF